MLQTLRSNPIFGKVVLSAVLLVMVLGIGIGVTSVFTDLLSGRASSSSSSGPWAIRVGPETISTLTFQSELRNVSREIESTGLGQMPDSQARARFEAMRRLVRRSLETQEARRTGIKVSDQEVSDRITSMPTFQRDGQFIGPDEYRQILARNELDVTSFENGIRDSVLMEKWESMVGAGAGVSEREVDQELAKRNQKVRFDFVLVDPSKHAPTPSESDVKAYYEGHPDRYQRGETRRARYVLIDATSAEAQVPAPTEDEIKKAYEADRASFPGTLEQSHDAVKRQVVYQKAQTETDRRAAVFKSTVIDAASLDAAAAKSGLKVQDTGAIRHDADGISAFGPSFLESLFQSPQGAVGGPARTLKGSAVFVVTETQPARRATQDEARKDIVADLAKEKGSEAALAAAKGAVAAAGGDLAKVAHALDGTVQNGPLISKGEPVPSLGFDPAVENAAFETEAGAIATPVATSGGSVVVLKVAEKKLPDPTTLAASRTTVRNELLARREQDLINAVLETASKRTDIKTNDEYFKQLGS